MDKKENSLLQQDVVFKILCTYKYKVLFENIGLKVFYSYESHSENEICVKNSNSTG